MCLFYRYFIENGIISRWVFYVSNCKHEKNLNYKKSTASITYGYYLAIYPHIFLKFFCIFTIRVAMIITDNTVIYGWRDTVLRSNTVIHGWGEIALRSNTVIYLERYSFREQR